MFNYKVRVSNVMEVVETNDSTLVFFFINHLNKEEYISFILENETMRDKYYNNVKTIMMYKGILDNYDIVEYSDYVTIRCK